MPGAIAAMATALWVGVARADPPPIPRTVKLEYVRGPGAQSCPSEDTLRFAIAGRMAEKPWDPNASARLVVTIRSPGQRTRSSATSEAAVTICSRLSRTSSTLRSLTGLQISFSIDAAANGSQFGHASTAGISGLAAGIVVSYAMFSPQGNLHHMQLAKKVLEAGDAA